ncbi:MAG: pseudouridine synthase [Deltaproteobacteria bacterium]|nr:pseudouridine synthase [Deltaproteobacteria bacterium]MCX7952867.1 pseudouridine synthase [Deltaproteobacteria bacterium]
MQQSNAPQRCIKILYQDKYIIVAYKPRPLDFHTDRLNFIHLINEKLGFRVYPVHRLDKDVDGVVIFGKTPYTSNVLVCQFKDKRIEKFYLAVVKGNLEKKMLIKKPIKIKGKCLRAETFVWPIETVNNQTLVKIITESGRFHQIKTHLYQAGYPIIRDRNGCLLSAVMISFIHPRSKKRLLVSCIKNSRTFRYWIDYTGTTPRINRRSLLSG